MVRRKSHKGQTWTFPTKTAAKTWADRVERERACKRAFATSRPGSASAATTVRQRVIIPACSPATMNVALGYLSELLKRAAHKKGAKLLTDPVPEARPESLHRAVLQPEKSPEDSVAPVA